ncbi:MAG: hypothetical protein MAG471_01451 [Acidimicrobiaceae bacterium]|nr:hypothetical protein [Acidimicrobiaceae bacterium]
MAECVAGTVQTGGLAVPDAEDPVVPAVGLFGCQLATHHSGGTQFLVHGWTVDDGKVGEQGGDTGHFQVQAAHG